MTLATERFANFAAELAEFVGLEAEATRKSFQDEWNFPLAERLARGRCLGGLEFHEVRESRFLVFRCTTENDSDLREGDLVRLSRGEPTTPLISGSLHRVEDSEIWVEPGSKWEKVLPELERGPDAGSGTNAELELGAGSPYWVLDRSYLELEGLYRGALKELGETARGRERILPLLCGELEPRIDLEQLGEAAEKAEQEGVNETQNEAIAQAVATDLCHLVQGPPGTGKTFVLAQVVKQRVARGEKVLVTAATHQAIHNALNMIRRVAPEIRDIAKIGPDVYDPELQVTQYAAFPASPLVDCTGGYVIGATPFSLRSRRMRGVHFDAVIVDEAGQVTLLLAVMAMLVADSYVLVGDHRQLPPVVQSLPSGEAHLASVFGRLAGRGYETMLELTYRMNAELVRWPAETFYSGKLRPAAQNAACRLALPQAPLQFGALLDPAQPFVLVEMEHCQSRRFSIDEATLVADLLVDLRRSGLALDQVAVVVPFRRQARRIRHFLNAKRAILDQDLSGCVIDTVERMQGQEREVVIVSMTASEPGYLARLLGFLLQPQRLNVALTRARSKLIVLASEQIAQADPLDVESPELLDLWQSLRQAAYRVRL